MNAEMELPGTATPAAEAPPAKTKRGGRRKMTAEEKAARKAERKKRIEEAVAQARAERAARNGTAGGFRAWYMARFSTTCWFFTSHPERVLFKDGFVFLDSEKEREYVQPGSAFRNIAYLGHFPADWSSDNIIWHLNQTTAPPGHHWADGQKPADPLATGKGGTK